ncbi:uncharacterized protein LAESUDRAFT_323856 [Laetiporus sulphureus 93-53]|uniref:Uncharacterized protein n=1 Tax=Laetiporus sulphureus 93-53 TaxID=1314785 RepID=A0A165CYE9_9APHY|nr:uncharacterized protein LAESUDRAFT_323856 [Laetiporus sulphureus 93-53]KZT03744.1 hypothetical protein LAESUDRAFT_323856 [Laetiporus sulphureus 93-53]
MTPFSDPLQRKSCYEIPYLFTRVTLYQFESRTLYSPCLRIVHMKNVIIDPARSAHPPVWSSRSAGGPRSSNFINLSPAHPGMTCGRLRDQEGMRGFSLKTCGRSLAQTCRAYHDTHLSRIDGRITSEGHIMILTYPALMVGSRTDSGIVCRVTLAERRPAY